MILKNCDMKTFSKRCKNKQIACYGIGGEFERIMDSYSNYEWFDKIKLLVDGNAAKEGNSWEIKNRVYKIVSLEYLCSHITSETVILITCAAYYEVVQTLNLIAELDQVECYLFHFMFSQSENETISIRQNELSTIPPLIHYCWFGGNELPDLYKRCIDSWHKWCPNYEIKEWNENNCDINETLFTQQAYESKKYGFVPDYFRLKIIYEYGGIYLDTDVEIVKNIDDLRYNEAFCGLEFPGEVALGLGFGARKNHPLMQKLMERYKTMSFLNSDGSTNEIGSPVFQSADLREFGMSSENRLQLIQGMTIYPVEVLSPQNVYTGITNISENTYMWHHYDGSWVSGERLKRKKKRQAESAELQRIIEKNEGNLKYVR